MGSDHKADLAKRQFERILLIKPSSLGDVIHALPVLHGLRRRYPDAKIDWLISTPFVPLLQSQPQIDELIPFDRKRFGRLGRSPAVSLDFLRFVRDLRRRRYDLVIDLQGLFRTGFLARASGAAVRIGSREAREGASLFYSHKLPRLDADTHAVDRNFSVGSVLGFSEAPVEFDLSLPEKAVEEAAGLLEGPDHASFVGIVPGARWDTKVWLPERFAETIDRLQTQQGCRCVLIGGGAERELCERIVGACRSEPLNLAGRTTLQQLAALIQQVDCLLCHDSGAMHLAVAMARPLVCLVGPTNHRRTGPYGRPEDVLQLGLDCAPCYLRRLSQCKHEHGCMRGIEVDGVVEAVVAASRERPTSAETPSRPS